uniref:Uncharacterized protein n=1 Tax=Angomonas deanei TaxID=59799 RepID=C6K3M0_9TRYP|nr:conserved hypothetical protein [Angomonas deanei]
MSSLTSSLAIKMSPSPCVTGTLPPSLIREMTHKEHHVVALLSATLPSSAAPLTDVEVEAHNASASADGAKMRYAVFENAETMRRWTVELQHIPASSDESPAPSWSLSVSDARRLGLTDSAADADVSSSSPDALLSVSGPRYVMLPTTWRETTLTAPVKKEVSGLKGQRKEVSVSVEAEGALLSPVPLVRDDSREVPPVDRSSPQEATANALPASPTEERAYAFSSLQGLSLAALKEKHNALLRRLVEVLAPQRLTVPLIVRKMCTVPSGAADASHVCEVPSNDAEAPPMRYTDADVAAAVEQLTVAHARQPKQRELKSEAYLLMNVDGFADGELRRKAANRAYPALAQQWPASAALLDAMERYVDRDVVMETRKRHPELSAEKNGKVKRKRQRSASSSASDTSSSAASDVEDEKASARTNAPAVATATPSAPAASASAPRHRFESLHEYPKSLARGDLRAWWDGVEGEKVRECLQAATTLSQHHQQPRPQQAQSSSIGGDSPRVRASSGFLSVLPIANAEDVRVLRGQYDALAAAETEMVRRLREYRDTVGELRAWYKEDMCAPQFQAELQCWVQVQEEARTQLTGLFEKLHCVRYGLERDLTDYVHLHALGVL